MQICRCYRFCDAGAARRNASTSLVFTFYLFKYLGFAGARFAAPLPRSLWRSPASFKENHFIFSWRIYSPSAVCLQPPNRASTPLRSFSNQPLVVQLPENWDWLFKSECNAPATVSFDASTTFLLTFAIGWTARSVLNVWQLSWVKVRTSIT